jgi:hypothetical protein
MAAAVQIAGIRKVFGKGERAVEVLKRIDQFPVRMINLLVC